METNTRIVKDLCKDYILTNYFDNLRNDMKLGFIISSLLTNSQMILITDQFYLCDGRSCLNTALYKVGGIPNVPDLRNFFLKGAGEDRQLGSFESYRTSIPQTPLTVSAENQHYHLGQTEIAGEHSHSFNKINQTSIGPFSPQFSFATIVFPGNEITKQTSDAGRHSHFLTTQQAGQHTHEVTATIPLTNVDTRPNNFAVNYFIKVSL